MGTDHVFYQPNLQIEKFIHYGILISSTGFSWDYPRSIEEE